MTIYNMIDVMKPALEVGIAIDAVLMGGLIGIFWYRARKRERKIRERLSKF